jgi:U3 small nucleolar RNA-associated protein 4
MVSWWNCELRIWRVKNQVGGAEQPKIVARLALQGDENITSVSITRDGGLLAVSTASEVKLFQLLPSNPTTGPALRIRKLDMPAKIGAKLVRCAANGKWLAVVTLTNEIRLLRVIGPEDPSERPRVLQQTLLLHRLQRGLVTQDSMHGTWGHYNRSISHAEFSSNANVFAVADLAGYVDTWVIEGHEDLTAPEVDIDSNSTSSDDENSDDESEAVGEQITFMGQRWIRNPSGQHLPRLDSTPLLLAFQPKPKGSTRPQPNGNPAVHPTRNNPHPHSHDLPDTDEHLLVVSAEHRLYHFEVLTGRLSDWSRRNPPSSYPSQFRLLDGPVKGCIWDVGEKKNRVWLYGEKWLFMFDLLKDFSLSGSSELTNGAGEDAAASKKRKRDQAKELSRKSNSGAGDAVPDSEAPVTKMRKYNGGNADESSGLAWIDLNNINHQAADIIEGLEDKHQALASLRRSEGSSGDRAVNGEQSSEGKEVGSGEEKRRGHEPWWHTFKYRPILGIVPVGGDSQALEVVIVERPAWDLDLPPRFVGSHE